MGGPAVPAGAGRTGTVDRLSFGTRCHVRGRGGLLARIKFSAASDRDICARAVFAVDGDLGDALEDFLAGYHVAEYGVFRVEMLARGQGDEEPEGARRISFVAREISTTFPSISFSRPIVPMM